MHELRLLRDVECTYGYFNTSYNVAQCCFEDFFGGLFESLISRECNRVSVSVCEGERGRIRKIDDKKEKIEI